MPDGERTVVRVGSYSVRRSALTRLLHRHGPAALVPHAVPGARDDEGAAVEWALRQATLRALAVPPRLGARRQDIEIRSPLDDTRTLLLRGELAGFAETVMRGDVQLSVTTHGDLITAWTVLTRDRAPAPTTPALGERREPSGPAGPDGTEQSRTPDETEVPE